MRLAGAVEACPVASATRSGHKIPNRPFPNTNSNEEISRLVKGDTALIRMPSSQADARTAASRQLPSIRNVASRRLQPSGERT